MKDKKDRFDYEIIEGINPVSMLLDNNKGRRKIYEIYILNSRELDNRIKHIKEKADEKCLKIKIYTKSEFENNLNIDPLKSQGVCAKVSNYSYPDLDDFLKNYAGKMKKLIILDGITDVGNFGGIIRSAFAFNFSGIIIPKNRSSDINKDVNRTSSGTLETMNIFRVTNLARTILDLKSLGFWIYGTSVFEENNSKLVKLSDIEFNFPLAIILGSEHKGVSRLLKDKSDVLVNIEINNKLDSLNVSVSAGILMYIIKTQEDKSDERACNN